MKNIFLKYSNKIDKIAYIDNDNNSYYKNCNYETLFDMASLTKIFCTLIILELIKENKLSLKNTVGDFFDDWNSKDVEIRNLLTHCNAIPLNFTQVEFDSEKVLADLKNVVPNTNGLIDYSDGNFILLGLILEKHYGGLEKSVTDFCKKHQLDNTFYKPIVNEYDIEKIAPTEVTMLRGKIQGVVHDEKSWTLNQVTGAAGIFSNTIDMQKLLNIIINWDQATINLLKKEEVKGTSSNRTLGFLTWDCLYQETPSAEFILQHTGFTGTSIFVNLEQKSGFVLLTNRVYPKRNNESIFDLRREIIDYKKGIYE